MVGLGVSQYQSLVSFPRPLQIPFIFQCLLQLTMSETNILPGAHDFVVSGTINAARIVRKAVRYSSSKLMACILQINIYNNFGGRAISNAVIPLVPNPSTRFTGRMEIIAKLKEHFSANLNDRFQRRKYFLLHGMGGIGKTQICLKFIEEMSDQ